MDRGRICRKVSLGLDIWQYSRCILPRQCLQDCRLLLVRVANAQVQHLVEATGSQERLIQQVGSISRSDHEHASAVLVAIAHAVELGE